MARVRKASLADLDLLSSLATEFDRDQRKIVLSEDESLVPYLRPLPDRDKTVRKWMRKWMRSRTAIILIAEEDGRPVGFSTVSIERFRGLSGPTRYAFIGFVFVKRRYRGRGVSSELMRVMLEWCTKRRVKYVALSVLSANAPARAIWRKWGFCDFALFTWKSIE